MSCVGKELVEGTAQIPIVDVVDGHDLVTKAAVLKEVHGSTSCILGELYVGKPILPGKQRFHNSFPASDVWDLYKGPSIDSFGHVIGVNTSTVTRKDTNGREDMKCIYGITAIEERVKIGKGVKSTWLDAYTAYYGK